MGILMINSPQKDIYEKDKDMYNFISTTEKESVFGAYFGNYKLDIPNIGERAIFSGNGFPFNESYLTEYQKRKELFFGTHKELDNFQGKWIGEKSSKFFRTKSPKYFFEISKKYKLDYIVIEKEYSLLYDAYKPRFENEKVKIYKISDFKENK
jgi:hypothetical protein